MFQCGFYEMEITPPLGSHMPGYFYFRPNSEVFDQLYVKAWVVGNGGARIALASVDCVGLNERLTSAIKEQVTERSGIPADHVMVACTHTHTGGPVAEHTVAPVADGGYRDFVVRRVADCIVLAGQRMKPSTVGFGAGWLDGVSFCRIYRMKDGGLKTNPGAHNPNIVEPYKAIDKTVNVVEIRQEGRVAGVVVNFANHCDVLGTWVGNSADYPGRLAARLKEKYGPHTVVLFLQGDCGNINHIDPLNPEVTSHPRRYIEIGDALADEVIRVMEAGMAPSQSEDLLAATRSIALPMRLPDAELLAWADETVKRVPQDLEALGRFEKDQVELYFAMQALGAHQKQRTVHETTQQVLKIGDLGLYGSPSELFSEYGDELREKSPFRHTIVAGYANAYVGYIVVPECIRPGVYEARQTEERSFAAPAGAMMNAQLLEMGRELFAKAGGR